MTYFSEGLAAAAPTAASDLVTVVVPARDESRFIGACLEAVCAQDHENLQIVVVVDARSRDTTADIVSERAATDSRVELVHATGGSIPHSLNCGLAAARGRWLVRVDAHSTVDPGYVGCAVERLREGRWGGVGGRKDGTGVTPAGRAIAAVLGSQFGVGGSVYHHGERVQEVDHVPFGAYPTALARELEGWDERLVANEDYEFDYRLRQAGYPLLFDPDLAIRWHSRQSVGDLFRQYRRYGRGKVAVMVKHPRSMRPRHVLVPSFAAYLALAGVVGLRRPVTSGAMVAPYLLTLAVATVGTGTRLGSREERAWVAPAFLAMHLGWGVGFWEGLGAVLMTGLRREPGGATRRAS